jgi:hypothetical protein
MMASRRRRVGLRASALLCALVGVALIGSVALAESHELLDASPSPGMALASASPSSSPEPSPTSTDAPGPDFLAGEQPLVETTWTLVGFLDAPGGRYISADQGLPAELRFAAAIEGQRLFDVGTGCLDLRGEWSRGPKHSGNPTRTMTMTIWGRDELPPCEPGVVSQDAAIREAFGSIGAYTVAIQGPDALGHQLTEADFDPQLWTHFIDHPDLTRLVLRDQSGEALLVYAPLDDVDLPAFAAEGAPSPSVTPDTE